MGLIVLFCVVFIVWGAFDEGKRLKDRYPTKHEDDR